MKLFKEKFNSNLLLKITSLNTLVVSVRLFISLIVQRILALTIGEVGIAKIGQLRNLIEILKSTASLGTFNGVVKYVSEFREENNKIKDLFSTTFTFVFVGSIITSSIVLIFSSWITKELFGDLSFLNLVRILALLPPIIGVNKVFHAVIHGLSEYKKYAKIEFVSYLFSTAILLVSLYFYELKGVLFSIIIALLVQLGVVVYFFGSVIVEFIKINELKLKIPFAKELFAFSLMSFTSTVLINYIELDIRTTITNKININEAGYWTAMNFISKNYMSFSSSLFTLYVLPKFAKIYSGNAFKKEVINIYKTLLPLFGLGMILVYIFRNYLIEIVYPNFLGMEPLFKWQLLGDFVRLATLVISYQFLAKKMVKSFILTELMSLALFYFLSKYLVTVYGVEGVVMAHFYRYIIYFGVVIIVVLNYFKLQKIKK